RDLHKPVRAIIAIEISRPVAIAHHQVRVTVIVVIRPAIAVRVSWRIGNNDAVRYPGKDATAFVVIEPIRLVPIRKEDVQPSVPIVVHAGGGSEKAGGLHQRVGGDREKNALALSLVEKV